MNELSTVAVHPADDLLARCPELSSCRGPLVAAAELVCRSFSSGGRLYLCGNGGSHGDALHIAGELVKSYVLRRPLGEERRRRLSRQTHGKALVGGLEGGLPAMALGANGAVSSAIANDLADPDLVFAQELEAHGRPGDVLLAISTSGRSRNVVLAAEVARSLDMAVVALTGEAGDAPGYLGDLSDVSIAAPAKRTNEVQEHHSRLYHALCEMIELSLF